MAKHILFALLVGLLVAGVSAALAEEHEPSNLEVLKAWGQDPMEVQGLAQAISQGARVLIGEELDDINAAGFPIVTNQTSNFAIVQPGILIGGTKTNDKPCFSNCAETVRWGVVVDHKVQGKSTPAQTNHLFKNERLRTDSPR